MATTYTHANFSVVDENHDVNVIYPQNTGIDVSIDRSQNATIPNDVSNAQQLANRLAATAFATNISDSTKSANTTWSSNKIDSELTQLSSDLRGGYNGTMKDLADNSGGSGAGIDDTVTANDSTWSSNKITSVISDYDSTLRGGYSGTMKDLYDAIDDAISGTTDDISKYPLVDPSTPRCILSVGSSGAVTSDYKYTLQGLHNVLNSPYRSDYIKKGDYIVLITRDGSAYKMVFNIDPYYDANADGTGSTIATHHIDMISENLIPNASWALRTANTNNGNANQKNPYLASNESGCLQANLADYYTNNIPDALKNHIIKKQLVVPYRYTSGSSLSNDNNKGLEILPELWIPFCREVGLNTSLTYESNMITYPIFTNDTSRIKKNVSGSAASWWLASANSGNSNYFCYVDTSGASRYYSANSSYGVALCFRFV